VTHPQMLSLSLLGNKWKIKTNEQLTNPAANPSLPENLWSIQQSNKIKSNSFAIKTAKRQIIITQKKYVNKTQKQHKGALTVIVLSTF